MSNDFRGFGVGAGVAGMLVYGLSNVAAGAMRSAGDSINSETMRRWHAELARARDEAAENHEIAVAALTELARAKAEIARLRRMLEQ